MTIDEREALAALLPPSAPERELPRADAHRAGLVRELHRGTTRRRRWLRLPAPALAAGALTATVAVAATGGLVLHRPSQPPPGATTRPTSAQPTGAVAPARVTVTIPDGLSVVEILARLSRVTKKPLAEFQAAAMDPAALGVPAWARPPGGGGRVLEGFLYPATYGFAPGATPKEILRDMVSKGVEQMTAANLTGRAAALHRTPWELLKVASLVGQEGIRDDFGKIARVVYNRLQHPVGSLAYLQFDSTTQYWLIQTGKGRKATLTKAELQDPQNNFSTDVGRLAGLPPTPIANPGRAALDAAASPPPGDWLYFVVTTKDGHASFTSDYSTHVRSVEKCRAIGRC